VRTTVWTHLNFIEILTQIVLIYRLVELDVPSTVTNEDHGTNDILSDDSDQEDHLCDGEDFEFDETVRKITDFVLASIGGKTSDNFDQVIRLVESAVANFLCELLNDLECTHSVTNHTQCGESSTNGVSNNTQSSGGVSSGGNNFGSEGAGSVGGGGESNYGQGGSKGNAGGNAGPDASIKPEDPSGRSSGLSCPYRKRNPARFGNHTNCAKTAWRTFSLLK